MWVVGGIFCHIGMDTNDLNHDLTTSPWFPPTLSWEWRECKGLDLYIMCHLIIDLLTAFENMACIALNYNVLQIKCVKYSLK